MNYLEDPDINNVYPRDLKRFLVYLGEEHVPNRLNGDTRSYSDSAISNHWKAFRSLFGFCQAELGLKHRPDEYIPMPKYQLPEVKAFTDEELKLLTQHIGRAKVEHSAVDNWRTLPNEKRNRAILFLLLETGMRVGGLNFYLWVFATRNVMSRTVAELMLRLNCLLREEHTFLRGSLSSNLSNVT